MTDRERRIQSCVDHINTAVDVDPWAKELVAEMGKEILKAQLSGEGTTSDYISRQAAIDICNNVIDLWQGQLGEGALVAIKNAINNLPSVQPYTDEEIQKIQELEQAQLDKTFELGEESAKAEIVRCKDCIRYHQPSCLMAYDGKEWSEDNGFCHVGEREEDDFR